MNEDKSTQQAAGSSAAAQPEKAWEDMTWEEKCEARPAMKNLRPFAAGSQRVKELARQGQAAAAAQRRRRRSQREIIRDIMSFDVDDDAVREKLQHLGLQGTNAEAANLAVMLRAVTGDVEALRYLRDTIGEKPTEQTVFGVLDKPVKALELGKLSDAELAQIADQVDDDGPALPEAPADVDFYES